MESRDRHPRVVDSSRDRHAPAELEALFHSASGVPADRREAWIESQCARGVPRELARRAAALAARVDDSRDIEPVSRSSQDEARVVRPLAQGPTSRAAFAAGAGLALVLAPHAASTSLSKTITSERNEMIAIRAESVLAAAAAASIAAAATAQDAVQWRVEDGGNGHWYQVGIAGTAVSWNSAFEAAQGKGGHLATVTSASELNFLLAPQLAGSSSAWRTSVAPHGTYWIGPWLGGFQDANAPGFVEPDGGWRWVTGEQWSFTNWTFPEPNDAYGGGENHLHLLGQPPSFGPVGSWNDALADSAGSLIVSYIIEWSSDCNNDGLVDYGQIRAGELDDANLNNIPDCCEAGTPCGCPGDIDRSGEVNGVDLAIVLQAWGGSKQYPEADLDGDGTVNGSDLATVLNSWGACP